VTGPPGAYEDLERADVILLIGANVAENHPILCWRLRSNPGTTLIVVDPRVTKTAMMADLHLPVRPRSDLALVNGLIHFVIEHDLIDREYVERAHDRLRGAARVGARLHARARRRDHRLSPELI
jgi:assimilatory nitrate reductase catalytic subunit